MMYIDLVQVDPCILSSYGRQGEKDPPRDRLMSVLDTNGGLMAPDAASALLRLHQAVLQAGGDFRISDCFRDVAQQMAARKKYETWLAAGKPAPGSAGFDSKTMKSAFVALPGKSNHNAGRAIDVHLKMLHFPVPADKQLDRLWEIAKPIGWTPIIKAPDEQASEAWHFDFWGPWQALRDRFGYETGAMCASLDVGHAGPWQSPQRLIQALIHRLGGNCGEIDGVIGAKTIAALERLGFSPYPVPSVGLLIEALRNYKNVAIRS